jgi:hypothetical protein
MHIRRAERSVITPPIVIFDDIRLMSMVYIRRSIDKPKLDITSFGHWSGTGLVEWTRPNR